ncbi:MAG: YbaB/EbfC family nucleoid-associated protein, partial [Planctomycetes bacterium]|nr:YbaB/EbfC family nucleoid-associated protein [Planctomycetota bacterium]
MLKGMGGMGNILKQAQKMQQRLQEVQQELKERVVEGSAGGGMVRVAANGAQEILSVKIDPEAVNAED